MTALGLDTSVAIPLLVRTHEAHTHDAELATRDLRACDTYEIVGARVVGAG